MAFGILCAAVTRVSDHKASKITKNSILLHGRERAITKGKEIKAHQLNGGST
jgi:hypothetical protein